MYMATHSARPAKTDHRAKPPSDSDVVWFGASRRLIAGQPDSRYGWLDTAAGPCIVKALNAGLAAYGTTLLQHERAMLHRLAEIEAPVPALVELGREDWLATHFAGISLQRLEQPGASAPQASGHFPIADRLAAWVHLLRRIQPMADSGMLAIDLYNANVVLPLTEGTAGQLRLCEAGLIDHAHTLEAGMNLRRPVWLDHGMGRIPPELRQALQADQRALVDTFRRAGADLPGYSRMPEQRDSFNRRVWAEYDAPQQLQNLLDRGGLSPDRAMQFAAGASLAKLLPLAPSPAQREALARVLQRMTAQQARERFATLSEAAAALAAVLEELPMVSERRYAALTPEDLACSDAPQNEQEPGTGIAVSCVEPEEDLLGFTTIANAARSNRALPWICAASALGAAIGVAWPLPW